MRPKSSHTNKTRTPPCIVLTGLKIHAVYIRCGCCARENRRKIRAIAKKSIVYYIRLIMVRFDTDPITIITDVIDVLIHQIIYYV